MVHRADCAGGGHADGQVTYGVIMKEDVRAVPGRN